MMRHVAPMLLATGLAAALVGCQSEKQEGHPQAGVGAEAGVEYTLVTLKVPNMV